MKFEIFLCTVGSVLLRNEEALTDIIKNERFRNSAFNFLRIPIVEFMIEKIIKLTGRILLTELKLTLGENNYILQSGRLVSHFLNSQVNNWISVEILVK